MANRYEIKLSRSWEVGIPCVYIEVKTKTRSWSNGPIMTSVEGFSVLTPEAKRTVKRLAKQYKDFKELLEAAEEGKVAEVKPMQVRLVMAGCKTNRRYLYVSSSDEFLNVGKLIAYAKEGADG